MHFTDFLFRYRGYNFKSVEAFKEDKLYFSTPNMFNDPYDARFYINSEAFIQAIQYEWKTKMKIYQKEKDVLDISEKALEMTYRKIMELSENRSIQQQFWEYVFSMIELLKKQMRENLKVICFSQQYISNLMWSHYADYHKGFCLMYQKEELKESVIYDLNGNKIKNKIELLEVEYSEEQLDIGPYLYYYIPIKFWGHSCKGIDLIEVEKITKKIISSKSNDWKYEDEWRAIPQEVDVFSKNDISYIKIKPSALFLGSMMDIKTKKELVDIARSKNIAIFEVYPNDTEGKYQFNFCKANLKEIRDQYKKYINYDKIDDDKKFKEKV